MHSTVISCLRYRDAAAAIVWLCEVLGFKEHLIVRHTDGRIAHAQLVSGGGMVMLGMADPTTDYGQRVVQPDEAGGKETQTCYVVVQDADAVYAKAKASGWKTLMAIADTDYGGRGFMCADPEGHLWSVGTYNPWGSN